VENVYILADNQDVTREGLRSYLKVADPDGRVVEVTNYRKLLEELRNHPLAVVVFDYTLFDFSSVSHLLNIKSGARLSTWLFFLMNRVNIFCDNCLRPIPPSAWL